MRKLFNVIFVVFVYGFGVASAHPGDGYHIHNYIGEVGVIVFIVVALFYLSKVVVRGARARKDCDHRG